jgi:hypothetical protein
VCETGWRLAAVAECVMMDECCSFDEVWTGEHLDTRLELCNCDVSRDSCGHTPTIECAHNDVHREASLSQAVVHNSRASRPPTNCKILRATRMDIVINERGRWNQTCSFETWRFTELLQLGWTQQVTSSSQSGHCRGIWAGLVTQWLRCGVRG